ncbi:MAG: phosphoserine transaminase [Paracoccaceae bacterium]
MTQALRAVEAAAAAEKPRQKPENPNFSSGPCAKRPGWRAEDVAAKAWLGRSHRASGPKAQLAEAVDRTARLLGVPEGYRVGIVPASDTGAYEMAMWTMLGARPVDMLAWESFGAGWVTDAVKQLKLDDCRVIEADYGRLPDLSAVRAGEADVCFTQNGTTSGVRVPDLDWIPEDRAGLAFNDATSAAFAQPIDWAKSDVTTFSWQKVLGGEGGHGVLILSPRAVERLESYAPPRPLPKIFRLTKGGKLNEGVFRGETINTPSMLAVADYVDALDWAEGIGLDGLMARATANAQALQTWVDRTDWVENLVAEPAHRSNTSVCLKVVDPAITAMDDKAQKALAKRMTALLDAEGAAYDVNGYRDAPAGLRIWCGATVETSDIERLAPWLDWAFRVARDEALA